MFELQETELRCKWMRIQNEETVTLLLQLLKQFGFSEVFSFLPSTLQLTGALGSCAGSHVFNLHAFFSEQLE